MFRTHRRKWFPNLRILRLKSLQFGGGLEPLKHTGFGMDELLFRTVKIERMVPRFSRSGIFGEKKAPLYRLLLTTL